MKQFLILVFGLILLSLGHAQEEAQPLRLQSIPLREEMKLIVTGSTSLPGLRAAFTTIRGEIWLLKNPTFESGGYGDFEWNRFATGLRRPTTIHYSKDDALLVRQYTETTRLADRDKDGIADEFLAVDPDEIPEVKNPSPFKGIAWLDTPESAGPFVGQYFGGSKSGNYLSRLSVIGDERGTHSALFVFQKGLTYPVDSMIRLEDNSWLIAQSNRAEPDRTRTKFALQRAVWNDASPFEVESIRAAENGFHLAFTQKLLLESAGAEWAYRIESMDDQKDLKISSVKIGADEKSVTLECPLPSPGTIYHISCDGVWSSTRNPVFNPAALFTFEGTK